MGGLGAADARLISELLRELPALVACYAAEHKLLDGFSELIKTAGLAR